LRSGANWCSIYGVWFGIFSAIELFIFAESPMRFHQAFETDPSLARLLQKVNTCGSKTEIFWRKL
jgi:hypothetical protein